MRRSTYALPTSVSYGSMAEAFVKKSESMFGKAHRSRQEVAQARRVIIKVGTGVVTRSGDYRLALGRIGALVEQLEALIRSGRQVILVTAGSKAVGQQKLRMQQVLRSSPLNMHIQGLHPLQGGAAAAAGQSGLMALYDSMLSMMGVPVAQFLVTSTEFESLEYRASLMSTVDSLLANNVVPVFNENDAISTQPFPGEKRHTANNDSLAAQLAVELKADLLILLSDVDGLYAAHGDHAHAAGRELISTYCPDIHSEMVSFGRRSAAHGHHNGGDADSEGEEPVMTEVQAAWVTAQSGCPAVIVNGRQPENILHVVAGQQVGTLFSMSEARRLQEDTCSCSSSDAGGNASPRADGGAEAMAVAARREARALQALPSERRCAVLRRIADALVANTADILADNALDVQLAEGRIDASLMQRLRLSAEKIAQLAAGIRAIAAQPEPIERTLLRRELAAGLVLEKLTAPIGVLLIIFEARPDALPQIASLAIRSGNGLLLKGGKEASRSNTCLHRIISDCLAAEGVGPDLIGLVTSRDEIDDLLKLHQHIDLVIPRGSNQLVSYIQERTKIPVLGHSDGICHVYVDAAADAEMAAAVLVDAKTDYPAACNAVEKVLVHDSLMRGGGLFKLQTALRDAQVEIWGGERAHQLLSLPEAPGVRHEYGKLALTLEVVDSMDEAIQHIHDHGSGHTDAIITDDLRAAEDFLARVDSACVLHNCSTRFADGYRFGLGAEVGISTGRIHARGPVGVEGLLTTKWRLLGHGQVVQKDHGVRYTHTTLPM